MASPYASSAKIAAAEAKLGGPIAQDSSLLLKQLVVALGNVTGGGGGGGSGTVTSVAQSFTGGLISVAGSPITTSGTLALTVAGTSGGIPYFSSASTWATSAALAANAIMVGGGAGAAPSTVTTGTGVLTALGVAVGSAGAVVVNGGALGTPSSGALTNCTSLPVSTGISGLGTGVATALAVNTGSAGAFVVNGGALGTPSSGTLTNCTGLPISTGISGLGTGVATALAIAVGSAGAPVLFDGALGTPSSGTLTNCTIPASGLSTTVPASKGGTGVANGASCTLTLPNAATTISTGGTIALGGFTLTVPATGTAALLATANAFTAAQSITAGTNSATPATGLTIQNTTAAISGTQSASPYLVLSGYGFRTGNSTSNLLDARLFLLPVQGSSADPAPSVVLQTRTNSGSWTELMTITAGVSGSSATTVNFGNPSGQVNITGTGGANIGSASVNGGFCGGLWSCTAATGALASANGAYQLQLGGSSGTILTGPSAATLQLGVLHATTPTAQTIVSHSVTTGTGANMIIGAGTGSTAGGQVILATRATTGALTSAFIVKASGVLNCPTMPTSSAGLASGDIYSNAGILTIV